LFPQRAEGHSLAPPFTDTIDNNVVCWYGTGKDILGDGARLLLKIGLFTFGFRGGCGREFFFGLFFALTRCINLSLIDGSTLLVSLPRIFFNYSLVHCLEILVAVLGHDGRLPHKLSGHLFRKKRFTMFFTPPP